MSVNVTKNSPYPKYTRPDDHTRHTNETPGLKTLAIFTLETRYPSGMNVSKQRLVRLFMRLVVRLYKDGHKTDNPSIS